MVSHVTDADFISSVGMACPLEQLTPFEPDSSARHYDVMIYSLE